MSCVTCEPKSTMRTVSWRMALIWRKGRAGAMRCAAHSACKARRGRPATLSAPRAFWIGEYVVSRHISARQRNRRKGPPAVDAPPGRKNLPQRRLRMEGPRRRVDKDDRLAREGLASNEPVEGVLERASDAMRVFRRSDHDGVARLSHCPEDLDRRRL